MKLNLKYFKSSQFISDVIMGMSDGLTVPFALAAGLSGSVSNTALVVIAGAAELAAGCISMGLGGYMSLKSEAEYYYSKLADEMDDVKSDPEEEKGEVRHELEDFGLSKETTAKVIQELSQNKEQWVNFMMKNELELKEPDEGQDKVSGVTVGLSYVIGGFIPLFPYIFISSANLALLVSVVVTLGALGIFGYVKGRATGVNPTRSMWQTALVGAIASGIAFAVARFIS